ncbi:MAG: prenyltransferase/squalene oxidase repeat-containing protein, partial [Desulfatiglandales bacterium]
MVTDLYLDVLHFVMSRRQISGGFGFVPTLPASVEDTYHAIRILEKILPVSEREVDRLQRDPRLRGYLRSKVGEKAWSSRTLYQYLYISNFSKFVPDNKWLAELLREDPAKVLSLEERYYLARIQKEFSQFLSADLPHMVDSPPKRGWRTARELLMLIHLWITCGDPLPADAHELIGWLQACQAPDGGFGSVPGSTSFIENTHWCIEALSLLGSSPLFPHRAREFILRCKRHG